MNQEIKISDSAFIAKGAVISGKVTIGRYSSIWYNCVIRSDYENTSVVVGENTNIQDGSVVHIDPKFSAIIGNNVTIGHNCTIHACTIGDHSLIGMGAVVLSGAKIGQRCVIAAGSVVKENFIAESNTLYAGVPARKVKILNDENFIQLKNSAEDYVKLGQEHKIGKYKVFIQDEMCDKM